MDKWIALVRSKLDELDLTQEQLAERVGVSQGGVGHWLNKRRQPDLKKMNKVFDALGLGHLEVALVIRERSSATAQEAGEGYVYDITSAFRYPVGDWATVGQVCEAGQGNYVSPRYELTDHYAKGLAFWLQVVGDAMTAPVGLSISEGMMILVDPDLAAEPGKMIVVRQPDCPEATFRQLIEEGGQRYLKPLNPTYPKVLMSEDCTIVGVVVQATAKL